LRAARLRRRGCGGCGVRKASAEARRSSAQSVLADASDAWSKSAAPEKKKTAQLDPRVLIDKIDKIDTTKSNKTYLAAPKPFRTCEAGCVFPKALHE